MTYEGVAPGSGIGRLPLFEDKWNCASDDFFDDGMWLQTLETRLSALGGHVQRVRTEVSSEFRAVRDRQEWDFRLLFGVVVTVTLGLAGLLAHGFKWI